jgi:hypothetical protein
MQIIAIWNTKGRNCLNACNKSWLEDLAKGIPEAKSGISYIHNDPYPSALNEVKEITQRLYRDYLHQTPQGPQFINSTLDLPQSSDEAN